MTAAHGAGRDARDFVLLRRDREDGRRTCKSKGVEFTAPIEDHGYGLVTFFKMPGDVLVQLYQPHYVKRRKPAAKAAAPAAARQKKKPAAKKAAKKRR